MMFPGRRALFGREGRAAAAGRGGVRVLDGKSASGDGVDEIDLSALEIPDADGIDEQPDPVRFEHLVGGVLVFFNHQAVLKPRTPAALHEHAQTAVLLLLFGEEVGYLRSGGDGY